ncbi:hydrocephalus-inducing protein-like isoform 1-T1 [Ara ararauna]
MVKKIVTIANNSAAPLAFKLRVTSTVPELQEAGVLCLKPSKKLKLKPRADTCKVEVTFSPKRRIQLFTGEVLLECRGLVSSLFVVRGSCQGSLVILDQDHFSFGAVVQQSYRCQPIVMRNVGDRAVRFLVVIDMLKSENLENSSVLQGSSYIDVPSSARKDYQLTFLSYEEGVFIAKVTFLNETTREYLFHMVTFKVVALGPIGIVKMSTAVRQRVSSTVKVDNPLPVPVTFDINCEVPNVSVPQHFTVPAQSKANLVLEYQPLKTGESTGHPVLQNSNLGSLSYKLQLKATSSRPEKPVYFRTTLGSRQTITTKIQNFAQRKTEYLLQTDCADFQTTKSISAAPASAGGSNLNVEVTFETCHLGQTKAMLQLSSALGGQYCIPLIGLALPPELQGPFLIPAGSTTSISFRNVFLKAMAFQYAVKHPAFTVRAPKTLCAKSSTTITVSFTGGPATVTNRLVVSCPGGSWIFHLWGLPSTC